MKQIYLKYKPHYKDNLALAIPVMISQVGQTLVQMADTIIVGHFAGTVSLAAVSLSSNLFSIFMITGIGISYGLTPLIAQNNGRKDYAECGALLSNSLLINIITGILLFSIVLFCSVFLLNNLHQTPEVIAQARPFFILLGVSVIPMMLFVTFKQFAEGLGFTKQAMVISILGNVLNVVLGIIFVKGLFGISPMGVRGVGYSTLITRCVMAIVMSSYVLRSEKFKKYLTSFIVTNIEKSRVFQILKKGLLIAMQYVFEISAFAMASVMSGWIGVHEQAAHAAAINLAATTYMMASGLGAAAAIKSGYYFGGSDYHKLRHSAISSYHIVLVFMGTTALTFAIFNQYLPWIYTSDKAVIAIASQLLIIAAFFQLFDGTQVVGLGILRGMGDVNIPTLITFISYWVIGLPFGYIVGIRLHWGVNGVWYGLVLALMSASVMLFIRFHFISKKIKDKAALVAVEG